MAEQPQVPVQLKPIPPVITHVAAAFGPLDLHNFIKSPNPADSELFFSAELSDGRALPEGFICTETGLLGGVAHDGTEGNYDVRITAKNGAGSAVFTTRLTINERFAVQDPFFLTNLKSQVWDALSQNLPLPELSNVVDRPITPTEVYYLLQRYAVLTIWDVYNLESPGAKTLLKLENTNPHYHIYDRGSCLVAAPKDLFSHERTLADALDVSRTLAREVYKRGWTIEFAGFNKMVRAAWVELQHLGDKHGKKLEILHYVATPEDLRVYNKQVQQQGPTPS